MAVISCKKCGGRLEQIANTYICECEYCGSRETLPNLNNDKKVTLFERANRFRTKCDFDRAAGIYESIIAEFPDEAEAYWCNVLCQYGIEYVDDPKTGMKIPTCHRISSNSILENADYKVTIEKADQSAKDEYVKEANQIEAIRRRAIEVSFKEDPYDIFICYKETDSQGNRTNDSVIAQDIYKALTDNKYKVFFSRITLESKLGVEYEPYIFAALNSSKVMLVVGTSYENLNSIWVKNEWSRFLKLREKSSDKYIVPCYKDMAPEDLPEEFSNIQGANFGQVGALQDLVRNIEKLIGKPVIKKPEPVSNVTKNLTNSASSTSSTSSRYSSVEARRAEKAAENRKTFNEGLEYKKNNEWEKAKVCFERTKVQDNFQYESYLELLLIDYKVQTFEELYKKHIDYKNNVFYRFACQYANTEQLDKLVNPAKYLFNNQSVKKVVLTNSNEKIDNDELCNKIALALKNGNKTDDTIEPLVKKLSNWQNNKKHIEEIRPLLPEYEKMLTRKNNVKSEIVKSINEKNMELSKLGFFDGGKKKEIKNAIAEENKKLEVLNKEICNITNKTKGITSENIDTEYQKVLSKINEIGSELDTIRENNNGAISYGEAVNYLNDPDIYNNFKIKHPLENLKYKNKSLELGDIITFGSYMGKEIKWRIVSKEDNLLQLFCTSNLDNKKFSDTPVTDYKSFSWLTSSLRNWANNDFLFEAFTTGEQKIIENHLYEGILADGKTSYFDKVSLMDAYYFVNFIEDFNKYSENTLLSGWLTKNMCKLSNSQIMIYMFSYNNIKNARYFSNTVTPTQLGGFRPVIWIEI